MSIIWAGSKAASRAFSRTAFAMTIGATARKRDKLAAQLTWLANRNILGLPEDRRHGRIVPRNPVGRLIMPNGVNLTCRIIDVSQSGAGIATDQRPPIGALVTLGKCRAASCVTSRTASPSSSPACSIPTFWKTTSPAGKGRRDNCRLRRALRAGRSARFSRSHSPQTTNAAAGARPLAH